MASTWIWRGSYDRLELIAREAGQAHAAGEMNGMPLAAKPWSAVKPGDAVLAWSDARKLDGGRMPGVWVLNENGSLAARMTEEEKRLVWRRAGLCGGKPLQSERLYRIAVVHLEPASMVRVDRSGKPLGRPSEREAMPAAGMNSSGGRERRGHADAEALPAMGQWPDDPAMRRVVRTAVQALYALGLDIGEAEVALGGDGRTAVRDAWPKLSDARLEAAALRRFAAWHAAAGAGDADRRELLIGADPEFVLVTPAGKIASASRFFGAGVGGAAGADAVLVRRRVLFPVAELRPEPAREPAELAANLRRLMLRAAERIGEPALRWAAGAMPVPGLALGGHIHISGAPLTARLLRLLDSFAAFPLALVEDPAGRARRPRYGTLGDFRPQPHGGFEYRTLPSWLVSPAAAKAAFALALLCAREAMNLAYIPALEERYAAAYYAGDREELAGCLDGVASSLAATASYSGLERYIEPLLEAARRGSRWDESADIRAKWRIPMPE
ncbi:putative amidoligase domain-containing protein [Paenibacillus arenilitoris]|uniref:PhiEco32-like amidoligase-type 2 protein n=1 Tax=Paenibacillus arenilitoris TaxID=2772299 RepID=A0A927CMA3_9BACL|nr:hypothetical protein [Paenibacillus arenilitoris]MBD2869847.1 hypothetical protein [Paenibacillus arenilitoris]